MNRWALFLAIAIGLSIFPLHVVQSAPTDSTATLSVYPASITAIQGQNFTISVTISNVLDLYGWEFRLNWTTTLVDEVNVVEGPFLKAGGSTFFTVNLNATAGYMIVDCTLLGSVPGVSGSGTLATITFYAKNVGESPLNLYDVILVNSSVQEIPSQATGGYAYIARAVGGIWIPVNKFELLAPYIGLALGILIVTVVTGVFVKLRRKATKTISRVNIQR